MAMDGSDSHGDADTLPQNHFRPDFKEYVLKEQLKWSLYNRNFAQWVFWSEQDHEIEPSLSLDNCADFNLNVCAIPKVRDNIRRALQKLMQSHPLFFGCLVQFWAATKTLEGRTKLTIRSEPFALAGAFDTSHRVPLCEYRMEMCRKYNCFYADAESGEEQLGLPGRVFRNQFPEFTHNVERYSEKKDPQRDLALSCNIVGSWAVPVFEHSSQTCVGVLEIVSLCDINLHRNDENFSGNANNIFQELGLQCFNGYPACEEECKKNEETVKEPARVLKELKGQLCTVCEIHELPGAMAWVPCSGCKGLQRCEVWSGGVEFCVQGDIFLQKVFEFSKNSHLRKGLVVERERSSNMLYCSDITQLSSDDYPLVPYVRERKLSGWFTICLEDKHGKGHIFVLEFFLSATSKDDKDINTTLNSILGTMEKIFPTFRIASGKELGELMSCDVIDFRNGQKFHSVEQIQGTREFSSDSDPLPSGQYSASSSNESPRSQDASMSDIKGKNVLIFEPVSDHDSSQDDASMSDIKGKNVLIFEPVSDHDLSSSSNASVGPSTGVTKKGRYG